MDPSHFVQSFVVAAASAGISKTALYPLTSASWLLHHALNEKNLYGETKYRGLFATFRLIGKHDGWPFLWKGNATQASRFALRQACTFSLRDAYLNLLSPSPSPSSSSHATFPLHVIAGGLAGATTQLLLHPQYELQNRYAQHLRESRSTEVKKSKGEIYKEAWTGGMKSIYRGVLSNILNNTVFCGTYFGLYESLKPSPPSPSPLPLLSFGIKSFFLAWGTTIAALTASYPIDTVRRRKMMYSYTKKEASAMHIFTEILSKEGWNSLFKGGGRNILQALPGASTLVIYDLIQTALSR